jgi:hypothetical protein
MWCRRSPSPPTRKAVVETVTLLRDATDGG